MLYYFLYGIRALKLTRVKRSKDRKMTTSSLTKYAYPSNLNVANFVSLKLTSTNFLLWETQVISLIESQDLIGFITGTISAPVAEIQNSTADGMMPNPDLAA